ncbi:MAG: hypothetical protein KGI51_12665 [Rhodospirillales bacterium]|nr:hypothetical protein [Rhodospirillales bacterium]
MGPAELRAHYRRYGAAEGRPCTSIVSRADFLALLPLAGSMLEIGPFCTPAPLSGRSGTLRYLDIMPTAALREAASALPWADPSKVPEIDYVWHGEPYRALIGERFDTIFSSHCIEHQPCLVSHLADIASVLTPGGRVFMVVPDHRFAFDHFVSATTMVDVLEAYAAGRRTHGPRSVIAQHLLQTHNDPRAHWAGDHGTPGPDATDPALANHIAAALTAALGAAREPGLPYDLHAWQFTPESFRDLFDRLATAGMSPFRIERLYPTPRGRGEFWAVLRIAA